jgi:sec-independent protein translocase protein TatA
MGPWQIVIIILVVVLLFGAGRLADIGKGLGEGIKNFKKGITEGEGDEAEGDKDEKEEPKQLPGKSEPGSAPADKPSEKKEV